MNMFRSIDLIIPLSHKCLGSMVDVIPTYSIGRLSQIFMMGVSAITILQINILNIKSAYAARMLYLFHNTVALTTIKQSIQNTFTSIFEARFPVICSKAESVEMSRK